MRLVESLFGGVDRGWKSLHWTCGLKSCNQRLFMRSIPQDRVGIRMGQTWYCTVDCLVKATRHRLSALAAEHSIEMPHQPRISIGSVLLGKGWITQDQLRCASSKSTRAGEDLETTLVRLGMVDESQVTSARATQWGYPVMGKERSPAPVETDLPVCLMRRFSAIPLHYSISTKRVLIGFVYRVEHGLLHAIEHATGCRAESCFITPSEYQRRIEQLRTVSECRDELVDDTRTVAAIANRVGDLALEVKARETSFSRCGEFVWMRLSGQRRAVNVLFRYRQTAVVPERDILPDSVEEVFAFG
ncbi:MAG: hypothetical protein WBY53_09060 [Acidobacteriaceae bacterium]